MPVRIVLAGLLLVGGVLLVLNEVRAAGRRGRPVRRGYVVLCVAVVVLGLGSAMLSTLGG